MSSSLIKYGKKPHTILVKLQNMTLNVLDCIAWIEYETKPEYETIHQQTCLWCMKKSVHRNVI